MSDLSSYSICIAPHSLNCWTKPYSTFCEGALQMQELTERIFLNFALLYLCCCDVQGSTCIRDQIASMCGGD